MPPPAKRRFTPFSQPARNSNQFFLTILLGNKGHIDQKYACVSRVCRCVIFIMVLNNECWFDDKQSYHYHRHHLYHPLSKLSSQLPSPSMPHHYHHLNNNQYHTQSISFSGFLTHIKARNLTNLREPLKTIALLCRVTYKALTL